MTPRELGVAASKAGKSIFDNPYIRDTPDWWAWRRGREGSLPTNKEPTVVTTEEIQAAAAAAEATQRPQQNKCVWFVVLGEEYGDNVTISDGLVGENWGRFANGTVVRVELSVVQKWLTKADRNAIVAA